MGDDPEEPSRERSTDQPGVSPDGGSLKGAGAVLPRFESPEPDGSVDARVLPRFEPERLDDAVDSDVRASAEPVSDILPRFEEAEVFEARMAVPERPVHPQREDSFGIDGPEYDQEMPLADHIEEMIKRLAIVIVVAGSVSLITWPFTPMIIDFLWYSMLPAGETARPHIYQPLEFLLTRIKVASLAGLLIALPILVYETYAFMRPGLYPNERKYYLAAIPTSLVLAVIGVLFAYFIVLPAIFSYFLAYSQDAGQIAFALSRTFDLILILMAYLAVVFQIPLLIMMAIMMGLTTRRWLAEKRLYFWGAFLGVAFLSSPDPTGMAPIIIALTMVALFEGTLTLLKWVGR